MNENELDIELINYRYKNTEINKWIKIYKRTKNKRIKNKQFVKILSESLNERKIIKCSDVVLMKYEIYKNLIEEIEDKTSILEKFARVNIIESGE